MFIFLACVKLLVISLDFLYSLLLRLFEVPILGIEWDVDLEIMQGGFTITSRPSEARSSYPGAKCYIDLAVQESPQNPAAAWLFQPKPKILGSLLKVRVGGSFVWPPPGILPSQVKRLVFVAGGVGIK